MDLHPRAAQTMEPIFLQSALLGDFLVNGIACNVERYGTMECSIKVSDRIGAGKRLDARFDDRQGRTVVSAYNVSPLHQ